MLKSTGVIPESSTPVLAVHAIGRTTATDENDGNNHEDDGGRQLEKGGPEFFLGVSQSSKDVDDDNGNEEDLRHVSSMLGHSEVRR